METFLAINSIFEERRPEPRGVTQGAGAEQSPRSCMGSCGSPLQEESCAHRGAGMRCVGQEAPSEVIGRFPLRFAIPGSFMRCAWWIRLWLRIPAHLIQLHGPEPRDRPGCSREGCMAAPCLPRSSRQAHISPSAPGSEAAPAPAGRWHCSARAAGGQQGGARALRPWGGPDARPAVSLRAPWGLLVARRRSVPFFTCVRSARRP